MKFLVLFMLLRNWTIQIWEIVSSGEDLPISKSARSLRFRVKLHRFNLPATCKSERVQIWISDRKIEKWKNSSEFFELACRLLSFSIKTRSSTKNRVFKRIWSMQWIMKTYFMQTIK